MLQTNTMIQLSTASLQKYYTRLGYINENITKETAKKQIFQFE